jgi:hypothetical protein
MNHHEKRDEALRQYKTKWGLNKYRFYTGYRGLEAVADGTLVSSYYTANEVRSLPTLISRLKQGPWLHEGQDTMWFESKETFLEYTLIKKLTGI